MEFSDFKKNPKDLIGKTVLHITNSKNSIKKISRITKTTFEIEGVDETKFNIVNGKAKLGGGRQNWMTMNKCELLTPTEEQTLLEEWKVKKRIKQIKETLLQKIDSLSIEQLEMIFKIIE